MQETKSSAVTLWPQWIGSIGAWLTVFMPGLMLGWSSPYLAQLRIKGYPLPISDGEATWIGSLPQIGRIIGAVLGSVSVDFFGSKTTLLLTNVPGALGWTCVIFADNVSWLYAARILCGIGYGGAFSSFSLYLGEICDSSIRGASIGFVIGAMTVGVLVGNIMGAYLTMTYFSYLALIPNVLAMILLVYLPESPHYLIKEDKIEDAERSILWYHRGVDVKTEVQLLKQFVNATSSKPLMERLRELRSPQNYRSIVIIILLFMFMQFSGLVSIAVYLQMLFTEAKVTILAPANLVILTTAVGIVPSWVAMYLVEKFGRRILFGTSCAGVCIAFTALGTHFMLLRMENNSMNLEWLPITSIIVFEIFMSIGLIPIPSTILGELFPSNMKTIAAFMSTITSSLFAFISTSTYLPLINLITEKYVYWLHAFIMVLGVLFAIFFMPETKGKSLQEIQDMLNKNNRNTHLTKTDKDNPQESITLLNIASPERLPPT